MTDSDLLLGNFVQVYLDSSILGCGWKSVFVDKITKKWVTLRDPFSCRGVRIGRIEWTQIIHSASIVKFRKGRLKKAIKERMGKEETRFSPAAKRMIAAC